jgi:flagellar basal-body rod modification protein FlgD
MSVASTTASTSSQGFSSSSGSQSAATSSLLSNYDTFLKMLTTQLRVQNPLEPMDAEKFTEQLVQYSAVEQQLKTNQNLEAMLATMVSSTALSLVNYIGKTVEASSTTTMLKDSQATWKLSAADADADADVTIRNSAGAVVYQGKLDLKKGENTFTWDGKMNNGQSATEGSYTISVDAKTDKGAKIAITSKVSGTVTAIDTSSAEPYLKVNGTMIPLSSLLSIGG